MTERETRASYRASARGSHGIRGWLSALQPWVAICVIALAVAVPLAVLGWGVDALASADRIHPGVRVGGVDVGGMSRVSAEQRLSSEFEKRFAEPVTVRYQARTWRVTGEDIGAQLDARGSASAAWAVGRTNSFLTDSADRLRAWFGAVEVPARVSGNPDQVANTVDTISAEVSVPARDATATVTGASVKLVKAAPGVAVKTDLLRQELLSATAAVQREVEVETVEAPVRVSELLYAPGGTEFHCPSRS